MMRPTSLVSLLMIDQLQGLPATAGANELTASCQWKSCTSCWSAAPMEHNLVTSCSYKDLALKKTCKTWGRTLAQEFSAWSATEQVHPLLSTQNAKDHMRGSSIKHWLLPNINAEIINGPHPSEKASSATKYQVQNQFMFIYIYI